MRKAIAWILTIAMALGLSACGQQAESAAPDTESSSIQAAVSTQEEVALQAETATQEVTTASDAEGTADEQRSEQAQDEQNDTPVIGDHSDIERALNLASMGAEWTYSEDADAWTLSVVTAVTNPEIPDEQGVSVCVPGAYVKGIDTDGDGEPDETSGIVTGSLIIDYDATITSTYGQIYTAATAPVIVNTGAAGYSEQTNQTASSAYAAEGYINVSCGNRGKQSTVTDADGNTVYTGDAPCCLVDQKNAVRFVKYNILLGNLPGSVDYFVSTGGSGGGAHAAMLAATSDHPDFYDYEIAAGAVGVYLEEDGNYTTSVNIGGEQVALSDGMWGCMAYSAITSLAEADLALAFEYTLDDAYSFNTPFQKQLAWYLAQEYMAYINEKGLTIDEDAAGFDLNKDGDTEDTVELTIEYDAETGYSGAYLDLYLAEFTESLQSYLNRLDYAEDWTWFDENGTALSDSDVAAMTTEDKIEAFIQGRYTKSSAGGMGGPGGPGGPGDMGAPPLGPPPDGFGGMPMMVGTPDAGTTQSASSGTDSANYASFDDLRSAYQSDVADVLAGDAFGNNIVELYDPVRYIGAPGTKNPAWTRVLMGASEGDISMLNSLNMEIAWLNAGTDAVIEWQWNGGHVPSEILGDSFTLYVDTMYGRHVEGAVEIEKPAAQTQTVNGTSEEAGDTDISDWIDYSDPSNVSFTLADIAAYRTAGASKAMPAFDVMDYGQEDYVFGSASADARHWNPYVLRAFEAHADTLGTLFNND